MAALSEKNDPLQQVEVLVIERDDTLQRIESPEASLSTMDTESKAVQRGTEGLEEKYDVELQQMGNATTTASRLQSDIFHACQKVGN